MKYVVIIFALFLLASCNKEDDLVLTKQKNLNDELQSIFSSYNLDVIESKNGFEVDMTSVQEDKLYIILEELNKILKPYDLIEDFKKSGVVDSFV